MKLLSFLLPAFAGLAAAADSEAEAYIIGSREASQGPAPSIPATVAQAILQQRLSYGHQLPTSIEEDELHQISHYGKAPQRIFADTSADEPNQLVIVVKNADNDRIQELRKAISGQEPSFTTPRLDYLPSSYLPSWTKNACAVEDATNLDDKKCWHSQILYLEYNAAKDAKALKSLSQTFAKLQSATAKLETILVLLPSTSTPSNVARRDFFEPEAVMSEEKIQAAPASSKSSSETGKDDQSFNPHPFVAKVGTLPACFQSKNACETATSQCSGHGVCSDKYGGKGANSACFVCYCQKTHEIEGSMSTWHWGGAACQKQDVSIPFWIFLGFTIFLIAAVGGSISLLFSVGEEKLPGVIGAGVSRGTK